MTIFTYRNLYQAYLACRANKRETHNALSFEWQLEEKLAQLILELRSREYRPGRSLCFVVTTPKPREIFAADFRDRVVQHLFVRELSPFAERRFSYDSFACRPGKGTHRAVRHLRQHTLRFGFGRRAYFLQLDIRAFFPSIDKTILASLTERYIRESPKCASWKEEMVWLSRRIIFHDPTEQYVYRGDPALRQLVPSGKSLLDQPKEKGLPIGNYTSQFFANLLLNGLDQHIRRDIGCRRYVRYADDLILLDTRKTYLREAHKSIGLFLRNTLDLRLHPKKMTLQSLEKGIDFLGYFLKPDRISVRRRVVGRMKSTLWSMHQSSNLDVVRVAARINSYYGHTRYARGIRLRQDMFERHSGVWKTRLKPVGERYISLRPFVGHRESVIAGERDRYDRAGSGILEQVCKHESVCHERVRYLENTPRSSSSELCGAP